MLSGPAPVPSHPSLSADFLRQVQFPHQLSPLISSNSLMEHNKAAAGKGSNPRISDYWKCPNTGQRPALAYQ